MKKFLLVLVLVLTLTLSGCRDDIENVDNMINREQEIIDYSIVSEKTYKWKTLLETYEIMWENVEYCIDDNEALLLDNETIEMIGILEGIEEIILDYDDGNDFHVLTIGSINVWIEDLQTTYNAFVENSNCSYEENEVEVVEVVVDGDYTKEQVLNFTNIIFRDLINDCQNDDTTLCLYEDRVFTVIEYDGQGEIYDVDEYTLEEMLESIE
jgi:uncharacterized lipoprotein YehR (DUF1307 family)